MMKKPITNEFIRTLTKRAISSSVRLQTTLKHCAVADSSYFDKLNRIRLDKKHYFDIIFKIDTDPLARDKINLSKEYTRGLEYPQIV